MTNDKDSYLPKLVELHLRMCEDSESCGIESEEPLSEIQIEALIQEVRKLRKAKKANRDNNLQKIKSIINDE